MLFKEFFREEEALEYFDESLHWAIQSNTANLFPLHLIREGEEKLKFPKLTTLSPGDSNPKTAKHPEGEETFMGSVLHLEPYAGSGEQMCSFATAIYRITAKNLDSITLQKVAASPGYEKVKNMHVFYGFELRFSKQAGFDLENTYSSMSSIFKSQKEQKSCPILMKIKLANTNLRDWSGPKIEISRNQIVHTELVGGCANSCLHFSGDPQIIRTKITGRRIKTLNFTNNSPKFLSKILLDLFKLLAAASMDGHRPVVRLNATSDISWESDIYKFPSDPLQTENILRESWPTNTSAKYSEPIKQVVGSAGKKFSDVISDVARFISGKTLLEIFPNITYYDYTKNPARMHQFLRSRRGMGNWPRNYYLTFSLAEDNRREAIKFLGQGGTIAAVFNVMKGGRYQHELPRTWYGFKVIDGDKHDFRFLDEDGVIVGLRAKGEAKYEQQDFGFVIQPDDPGLDQNDPAVQKAALNRINFANKIATGKVAQPGVSKAKYLQAGKAIGHKFD